MDAVEEIKGRLSIEDVIGEYVQLKRAGRNWRGLSPFSNEKTPSFMVSPEKQIWHDFSSGKGGDVFGFVMEVEGLEFKGALELLARKAGIDLEQYGGAARRGGPNKERLHELLELSTKFYQVQFSKSKTTLEYVLKQRRFSKETALEWRLGYAPNTGSALIDFAKSKGFSETEIKQAGLSARGYRGGTQDMFRGRLMIPLQDAQGRVIGFTARQLDEQPNAPKYINTPQTVLYDKSRHIYGLHLAKPAIRKAEYAVLVEGNLDVIASHQAGVRQVVATAGTALTEPHLKALSRFTGDIRLCYDADKAGLAATERAIPIASRVNVSLSIVNLPAGQDPDDVIRQDPKQWQQAIAKHQNALDWLMAYYEKQLDLSTARGKRQFSDVLLPVVRSLADEVEQDHYVNVIAKAIDTSREALTDKLRKTKATEKPALRRIKASDEKLDRVSLENRRAQDQFLSLVLARPTLREFLDLITPEMLFTLEARTLFKFLIKNPDFNGPPEAAKPLREIADYAKIEALLYEELYQGLELNELHDEAARLQARLIEQFIKTKKAELVQAMTAADEAATRVLLEQAKQYDSLLNQVKGAANA